jgi:prolyl-tRNA editing enzyme YbaK/EbsC (Cys-tRNA(Pro) deacylase)
MMNNYHPVASKIKELLDQNSFWYETFEHEPVRTSEQAAALRTGYELHQGAKAIILRIRETGVGKKFLMLVIPGDRKFDQKKLKSQFPISDIRFATEEEVGQVTGGVLPGGVPPFGNLFGLEVIADRSLLLNEKIIFNAGDRSFSVAMMSVDYVSLVQPKIADIT